MKDLENVQVMTISGSQVVIKIENLKLLEAFDHGYLKLEMKDPNGLKIETMMYPAGAVHMDHGIFYLVSNRHVKKIELAYHSFPKSQLNKKATSQPVQESA